MCETLEIVAYLAGEGVFFPPLCVLLQVRKEQQILRAGGDRLWKTVGDLQVGMDELKSEQGAMRQRMSQILHKASRLSDLSSGGRAEPSLRTLRVRSRSYSTG